MCKNRSLLNREISEYPYNLVPETDLKYLEVYEGFILFDVNVSKYASLINRASTTSKSVYK